MKVKVRTIAELFEGYEILLRESKDSKAVLARWGGDIGTELGCLKRAREAVLDSLVAGVEVI